MCLIASEMFCKVYSKWCPPICIPEGKRNRITAFSTVALSISEGMLQTCFCILKHIQCFSGNPIANNRNVCCLVFGMVKKKVELRPIIRSFMKHCLGNYMIHISISGEIPSHIKIAESKMPVTGLQR